MHLFPGGLKAGLMVVGLVFGILVFSCEARPTAQHTSLKDNLYQEYTSERFLFASSVTSSSPPTWPRAPSNVANITSAIFARLFPSSYTIGTFLIGAPPVTFANFSFPDTPATSASTSTSKVTYSNPFPFLPSNQSYSSVLIDDAAIVRAVVSAEAGMVYAVKCTAWVKCHLEGTFSLGPGVTKALMVPTPRTDPSNIQWTVFVSTTSSVNRLDFIDASHWSYTPVLPVSVSAMTLLPGADRLAFPDFEPHPSTPSGNNHNNDNDATGIQLSDATVAAGNSNKLYLFNQNLTVLRWEWVTVIESGAGGVIDGPITAMDMDACGQLYVGTTTVPNVMFRNVSVARISGEVGLPLNGTKTIARGSTLPGHQWLGTNRGLVLYHAMPNGLDSISACYNGTSSRGDFLYFAGRRWLPDDDVLAVVQQPTTSTAFVLTRTGFALIHSSLYTLADKAAHYSTIVPRHERYGFTADCGLGRPGDVSTISCQPGESDGLWTGIMLAAESLQWAVEPSPELKQRLTRRISAMQLLYNVTGIPGYMARTAAPFGPNTNGGTWHNSTVMPGWAWMGDTSADEVCGHFVGLPLAYHLVGDATEQKDMIKGLLDDAMTAVVKNGFRLIGFDGMPTRWGIWSPEFVNGHRDWSDQRGLNSLQILAFLRSVANITGDPTGLYAAATADLTNATNSYDLNLINLKIEAPIDDNYSDDELAFLPAYTYWQASPSDMPSAARVGLQRLWSSARREKSSAWNAIYMTLSGERPEGCVEDMLFSLQSWPWSLVDWDTDNSIRMDIEVNPEVDRRGRHGTQSMRSLPGREKSQFRWNSNPFELVGGANGQSEFDPGAWLFGYWMARYHGLL